LDFVGFLSDRIWFFSCIESNYSNIKISFIAGSAWNTARNLTGLSQAVDFTGLRQVVNKSRQVCWFRQAVTGLREQVCRELLTTEP
jgi:hypothetical protein